MFNIRCIRNNFNSIKVRLKPITAGAHLIGGLLFQFHKGTIKTPKSDPRISRFIGFQFHKGTIKTINTTATLYPLKNFNSIKVRLKQGAERTE